MYSDSVAIFLIIANVLVPISESYNILVLQPHNAISHFKVFEPLFQQLALKGHNVTVISYFPQKKPIPNYRDVSLVGKNESSENIQLKLNQPYSKMDFYKKYFHVASLGQSGCVKGLANENFQAFLREDNHFDVILAEFFNTNCFWALAKKYKAPLIGFSTCQLPSWFSGAFGNPENPSYMPNLIAAFSDEMNFFERLDNTFKYLILEYVWKFQIAIPGYEYSKQYLGIDMYVDGKDEIMHYTSSVLVNTHFTLHPPRPVVPGVIHVGGIHIPESQKLPTNIEKIINESTDGVIYMSMGSVMTAKSMGKHRIDAFLKAFSKIKQRVIWKWDEDTIEGKPENVELYTWAPQRDLLCHPNVKAFITHGGLLSIIEAVHCGVPMIVMPCYGDQPLNAKAMEVAGGGVFLKLEDVKEETILESIQKIMTPETHEKMKILSEKYKDRPLSPMDTAIYWVEYVAKYKGAEHMRTAAVDMPFYKYFLLDVIAFLVLVTIISIWIVYLVVKAIFTTIFTSTKKLKKS